ncbi:oxidoreductase [Pseudomonas taiwanensis]|uniref:PDR/VanB family oxidoreductase n=1 Tax=Pseudomonas taiwanensis TaxID=470150 RepID=UPI0015BD1FDD|nr:PDR/VanB family oxidoreductase [Pseudomonas taiwanensis]NWL77736.1 oxidoreductase [Pseudomonas taiwanensis]
MIEVRVTRKHPEAEGIVSFELARADGGALPPFSAGSHIDVHLPNGQVRQYSLCNHPDERHRYQIAVLLDPASRGGSQAMHEQVGEGSGIRIGEPRNLFPLAHGARRTRLFAGGIGITPILCMAERLAAIGAEFEMHYCGRSAARTAFVERIEASAFAGRVSFHFDDTRRLQTAEALADYADGDHLYVCGPGGFMAHVLDEARKAGWPESALHREYFAAEPQAKGDDGAFEVQLASDGRCFQVPADRSVADVLQEAGIDLPLSCEQGICGTCLTRVLEGEPEHRDMFLTVEEQGRNDQFTPCCSRSRSPRLVLDL